MKKYQDTKTALRQSERAERRLERRMTAQFFTAEVRRWFISTLLVAVRDDDREHRCDFPVWSWDGAESGLMHDSVRAAARATGLGMVEAFNLFRYRWEEDETRYQDWMVREVAERIWGEIRPEYEALMERIVDFHKTEISVFRSLACVFKHASIVRDKMRNPEWSWGQPYREYIEKPAMNDAVERASSMVALPAAIIDYLCLQNGYGDYIC